ncbi:MAG: YkvA family protein [Candidatus Limnocylindrales bacterium]
MSDDPFPREPVAVMLRRLPAYLRLTWRLAREPLLSRARRAAIIGAAGYLASPIDLVPGVIPIVGQLDDLAVALAAIRIALSGLSPERRRLHLEAVGLTDADLTADLRTVGATTAWILRAGLRATARAAKVGGRAAVAGAGTAARGSTAVAKLAVSAARSASGAARERLARRRGKDRSAETLPVECEGDVEGEGVAREGDPPPGAPGG